MCISDWSSDVCSSDLQPLPPLATFDATPPAEIADEGSDGKAVQIRYDVTVKGLDEIDAEDQFRALSALEDGDGKAAKGTMVAARAGRERVVAGERGSVSGDRGGRA